MTMQAILEKDEKVETTERRYKRIYIAGRLSTLAPDELDTRTPSQIVCDYITNLNMMLNIANQVKRLGYAPYVPGLDFLHGLLAGNWQEDDYRELGMAFLEVCDAVLVTSDSWGVRKEIERAEELGIPVVFSIKDLM